MEVCNFLALVVSLWTAAKVLRVECAADTYMLDDSSGLGRVFDGIGAISGGGATSRLLVSYPEEQRHQILDYLFKPNFAASLQILKVEIGSDAQSTDGTEPSHMRSDGDENYQRGYEWWMMSEAKKRNPDIKLYGLPWAYPAWVARGQSSPFAYPESTAEYIVKWITGAKSEYNLTIDYIGIWNERGYDATYVKILRKLMDMNSLEHVQIVAADGSFEPISSDVLKDQELFAAVSILGAHYPMTQSDDNAMATKKQLWSSEDFSLSNNDVGAACWATLLNQNYVNGHMTGTIAWNLIVSYYQGLPFWGAGLMTAIEPWSGYYEVKNPIWTTAHTTQFTRPGLHYLPHGKGVGLLNKGGSYVTFFDKDNYNFTVVIETMSHDKSACISSIPSYNVTDQTAVFKIMGNLATARKLQLWVTDTRAGIYFKQMDSIQIQDGVFSMYLKADSIYTLSTNTGGQSHSSYPSNQDSTMFPIPYKDDFDSYVVYSEAGLFADQTGAFEIAQSGEEKYMQQATTSRSLVTCSEAFQPMTVIGNISWYSVQTEVVVRLVQSDTVAFLAVSYKDGECSGHVATGVYLALGSNGTWAVYEDQAMKKLVVSGVVKVDLNTWTMLGLEISKSGGRVSVGNMESDFAVPQSYTGGFVAIGTGGYYPAHFDNFSILQASSER